MWSLSIDDLAIKANTMHGILGHSGSGKTTLLNMLALLDLPDNDTAEFVLNPSSANEYHFKSGKWEVIGASNGIASSEIRKRHFGFVFQAGYLISALTAVQNVAMPLSLSKGTRGAHEKARALLMKLGIESHRLNALPRHLSGGEYQRVAVARAIAHDPDVVFADEPTGNLDPDTAVKTMDTLAKWQKEGLEAGLSRTVVLVTHNVSQALTYCDNLTVLSAGKKVLDRPRSACTSDDLLHAIEKRSSLKELP